MVYQLIVTITKLCYTHKKENVDSNKESFPELSTAS